MPSESDPTEEVRDPHQAFQADVMAEEMMRNGFRNRATQPLTSELCDDDIDFEEAVFILPRGRAIHLQDRLDEMEQMDDDGFDNGAVWLGACPCGRSVFRSAPSEARNVFCSDACKSRSYRDEPVEYIGECTRCGGLFLSTRPEARFCSTQHRVSFHRQRRRESEIAVLNSASPPTVRRGSSHKTTVLSQWGQSDR